MKAHGTIGVLVLSLLVTVPCWSEEPTSQSHTFDSYLAAIDRLGPTYLRVGYLYHDLIQGKTGDAVLEAWEDGDRYRYEVDAGSLANLGQMGTVKYSFDGHLAMMKWPGTHQLVVARQPHSQLPLPVPHPLALLVDFVAEETTLAVRFRTDDVLEGWRVLQGSDERAFERTNTSIHARGLDGARFEVSLQEINRWLVPTRVEKTHANGQRFVVTANDWQHPTALDELPLPRQIDLDVWDPEGRQIGHGVLRLLEFRKVSHLEPTDFQLDLSGESEVWVDEEEQLYRDVESTMQRLRNE